MWQPRIFGITTVALLFSVLWLHDGQVLALVSEFDLDAQAIRVDITIKQNRTIPPLACFGTCGTVDRGGNP
jgi:hypothetical protein